MRWLGIIAIALCASACKRGAEPVSEPPRMETLRQMVAHGAALRNVPFHTVIEATTGHRVIPIDQQDPVAAAIVEALGEAVVEASETLSAETSPLRRLRRINEASRYFENEVLAQLNASGEFGCEIPPTADGASQRSGYPDLKLTHLASGRIAYLDPKLFEQGSRGSSFRSFYYEPKSETNKVLEDAHHLLLGIEHDGRDGAWQFTNWHLVDLSKLSVRLKPEFQAANRDLYLDRAIISSGK